MNSIIDILGSLYQNFSWNSGLNSVIAVSFIASILVTIIFACSVKNRIRQKKDFDGFGWGIVNGIFGTGILWVIIAHNSISKDIARAKDRKYVKYANEQMQTFIKTYAICLILWIAYILSLLLFLG
ncbi:hypothetical protein IJI89_03775 [Candidatus Saccharibacteria bacterium]|nr:hypothetical protein [Candidatus Saccharibacteria bacterium]